MPTDILYIQYLNPASLPPLEHGSRILAAAGWRVTFAGVNNPGLRRLAFPPHPRVRVRLMRWQEPGWRQKAHYLLFCLWVVGLAVWLRPRWVYASDLFACLPGLVLRALGFRVLYHEHDHPAPPTGRFLRLLGTARRRLARRCPCVLPNQARAELFRAETGASRVTVVWNCPARDEVRAPRPAPTAADELTVFYVGVLGATMLPKAVIAGLAAGPPTVRLVVVGYEPNGGEEYTAGLRQYAADLGVAGRVTFLGAMPRRQFYEVAAGCDVGLVLPPRQSVNVNIRHLLGASNKAFDYLACGLALLVTDLPRWRAFAAESECGLACDPDDPTDIAAAFRWFAGHRAETWAMGESGRRRVLAEWNYETQFRPVAERIGRPPGRTRGAPVVAERTVERNGRPDRRLTDPAACAAPGPPVPVDVLYIQYANPALYPPLEHSSHLLADAGRRVLFLGIGALGPASALAFPPHPRIRTKLMPYWPPGWRQKIHYLLFCFWVVGQALWLRPRWVYVSDLFACLPGLVLKAFGFRVLYHEHDHPGLPTRQFLRWLGAARRRLARGCTCVLPNRAREARFRSETGAENTTVVWNCPSTEEVGEPADTPRDVLWVLYQGSVVPDRLPVAVVQALARVADRVRLRVIGYETIGSLGYVDRLREQAEKSKVAHRVEFLGAMPRRDLFSWCRKSHVGLALMPVAGTDLNMTHMIGASNKVFEYFSQGLAVLVTDLPDWRAEYVEAGLGLACQPNDVESVATALQWFADHPAETRAMGEAGRRRVATEWNYETQFQPVAALLGATAAGPSICPS